MVNELRDKKRDAYSRVERVVRRRGQNDGGRKEDVHTVHVARRETRQKKVRAILSSRRPC